MAGAGSWYRSLTRDMVDPGNHIVPGPVRHVQHRSHRPGNVPKFSAKSLTHRLSQSQIRKAQYRTISTRKARIILHYARRHWESRHIQGRGRTHLIFVLENDYTTEKETQSTRASFRSSSSSLFHPISVVEPVDIPHALLRNYTTVQTRTVLSERPAKRV